MDVFCLPPAYAAAPMRASPLEASSRTPFWLVVICLWLAGCGGPEPAKQAATAATPPDGNARLDPNIVPTKYTLDLRVDPATDTTRGRIEIELNIGLNIGPETRRLNLHGERITVNDAALQADGLTLKGVATSGPHGGLALDFKDVLPKGKATLTINFQAPLEEVPEGLYRVKDGAEWYAFSQFEPLEARRAFPCFDEPGFKAPWHLSLRVPNGQVGLTNSSEVRRVSEGGFQLIEFAPTPPLPTYLIAFAVGPLDVIEAPSPVGTPGRMVPFRVITTKGKGHLAAYPLKHTPIILKALTDFFGRPYPYDKLDLVAVPNFAAGAMENPGLITFRERLLLLEDSATVGDRMASHGVIAHELAHMWFGDLVTMAWWDDLWLNEAFATWMATRIVETVEPSFEADLGQAAGAGGTMSLDGQTSARAIRQLITNGGDIYNAFDGITYGKGSLVLGMLESYLGAEVFRDGIRAYLDANAHGSATTADLMDAWSARAGRDIGALMAPFLDQPGTPFVELKLRCGPTPDATATLDLSQTRWLPQGSVATASKPWNVPICVRYALDGKSQTECHLLESERASVELKQKGCPSFLYPNADERGYYRWRLPPEALLALLRDHREKLSLREKVTLTSHLAALLEAGGMTASDYADALLLLSDESHRFIVGGVASGLRMPFHFLGEKPRPDLSALVRRTLQRHLDRLGFDSRPDETPGDRLLRNHLIYTLADITEDPQVLSKAQATAKAFVRDPQSVDTEVAALLVPIAAWSGDTDLHARLREVALTQTVPARRETALRALGAFRRPELLMKSLDLVLDGTVRAQDFGTISRGVGGREVSRRTAWTWMTAHYEALVTRIGEKSAPGLPFVGAGFCASDDRAAVDAFFRGLSAPVQGTERNLKLALEGIDRCVRSKTRHAADLEAWLRRHSTL